MLYCLISFSMRRAWLSMDLLSLIAPKYVIYDNHDVQPMQCTAIKQNQQNVVNLLFTTVTEIELCGTAINNENLVLIWQESSKYKTLHIVHGLWVLKWWYHFSNIMSSSIIEWTSNCLIYRKLLQFILQNFLALFDADGVVFTKKQVKNVLDLLPVLRTFSLPNDSIDYGDLSELVPFLLGIEILHIEDIIRMHIDEWIFMQSLSDTVILNILKCPKLFAYFLYSLYF